MNDSRTAGIFAVLMGVVLVLGIMYLAFGERLGIKSAGPNVSLHVEAAEPFEPTTIPRPTAGTE